MLWQNDLCHWQSHHAHVRRCFGQFWWIEQRWARWAGGPLAGEGVCARDPLFEFTTKASSLRKAIYTSHSRIYWRVNADRKTVNVGGERLGCRWQHAGAGQYYLFHFMLVLISRLNFAKNSLFLSAGSFCSNGDQHGARVNGLLGLLELNEVLWMMDWIEKEARGDFDDRRLPVAHFYWVTFARVFMKKKIKIKKNQMQK